MSIFAPIILYGKLKKAAMYCKKCGKQIADDSVFCQFCGTEQDVVIKENTTKNNQPIIVNDVNQPILENKKKFSIKQLTEKQKIWIGIYAFWFVLNFVFILVDRVDYASEYFFPFNSPHSWESVWDLQWYDISEFVVYVILIPLAILGIRFLIKKRKAEQASTPQADGEDNSRDNLPYGL